MTMTHGIILALFIDQLFTVPILIQDPLRRRLSRTSRKHPGNIGESKFAVCMSAMLYDVLDFGMTFSYNSL